MNLASDDGYRRASEWHVDLYTILLFGRGLRAFALYRNPQAVQVVHGGGTELDCKISKA